jgi:polyphosphate kinase 2 (PPK2 family)
MGFCTADEYTDFMATVNGFELALTRSGTKLVKYWLDITDNIQEARFQQRLHDPRRRWKLSPMDLTARSKWVDYSRARDSMLFNTSTPHAPWFIVDANVKRQVRLNIISHLLSQIPYEDKTPEPLELPKRQEAEGYRHPDFAELNFVPSVYP